MSLCAKQQLSAQFLEVLLLLSEVSNSGFSRTKWTCLKEQGGEQAKGTGLPDTFRLLQVTWSEQKEVDPYTIHVFVFELCVENRLKHPWAAESLPKHVHPCP